MAADSNRAVTGRTDDGRRAADVLERIATAAESIDRQLGDLAVMLEHYRPAIDRAARLAGSPAAKAAAAFAAVRPGGRRG